MPGPARAGALLYASHPPRVARFYDNLLGMKPLAASPQRIVLESPDFQLIIHALPPEVAPTVTVPNPVQPRQTALRLFFTVPSIAAARTLARQLGGDIAEQEFAGPGFVVCNAMDPEGNIFQVREARATAS